VIVIGLVSLLNDFASEMVTPLIPLLLVTVLAAGPATLGLIEGLADTVTNLLKLWVGRVSDRPGRPRKPYVIAGYALSNAVRPLIGLSNHWLTVLAIRVTDRVGKGVRTAPRDALIAEAVEHATAGRAYGLTRALDHTGAVLGALTAAAVVWLGTEQLEQVILLSALPGMLAVALIAFGVREPPRRRLVVASAPPSLRWSRLGAPTRRYFTALALFALARIPETFLLLRGHELGLAVVELLLLWAAMHVVKSAVSESAGRLSDRIGRRPVILAGYALYGAVLAGLAFVDQAPLLWAGALLLGGHYGLTEGAERALVRDLTRPAERGTAFGWFHMIVGLAAIPGGLLLGGLWQLYGARPALLASAALAVLATLWFWRRVPA
jgi:MFS family permease